MVSQTALFRGCFETFEVPNGVPEGGEGPWRPSWQRSKSVVGAVFTIALTLAGAVSIVRSGLWTLASLR